MLALRSKHAACILIAVSLVSSACANKLVRVAQIGREVGKAAVQLQQDEVNDYRAGRISPTEHEIAQNNFELLGLSIKAMNSAISVKSLTGTKSAVEQIQKSINSFSTHVTSSGRLQIWITIINGFIATMLALL